MKFVFIAKHRWIWPVAWMCNALGVSRSGFHAWLTHKPSRRAQEDEAIGAKVRASFIGSARTAVIDLFSRHVVDWSMKAEMTAGLVTDALVMAIWRRGKLNALLHHSDRGSQYTSEQFQRLLADNDVTCSTSRSGNCWDNAAMESFFSSLKTERTAAKVYRTRDQTKADVFD